MLEEENGATVHHEPCNDETNNAGSADEQYEDVEDVEASSLQETSFMHALRDLVTSR